MMTALDRRVVWTLCVAFGSSLAGCATESPSPRASGAARAERAGSATDYSARIASLDARLDGLLDRPPRAQAADPPATPAGDILAEASVAADSSDGFSEEVDEQAAPAPEARAGDRCETAAEITERICELARRLCDIAARNPDDETIAARCDGGHDACERARRDLAASCP